MLEEGGDTGLCQYLRSPSRARVVTVAILFTLTIINAAQMSIAATFLIALHHPTTKQSTLLTSKMAEAASPPARNTSARTVLFSEYEIGSMVWALRSCQETLPEVRTLPLASASAVLTGPD